jgi:hypothetical protein
MRCGAMTSRFGRRRPRRPEHADREDRNDGLEPSRPSGARARSLRWPHSSAVARERAWLPPSLSLRGRDPAHDNAYRRLTQLASGSGATEISGSDPRPENKEPSVWECGNPKSGFPHSHTPHLPWSLTINSRFIEAKRGTVCPRRATRVAVLLEQSLIERMWQ